MLNYLVLNYIVKLITNNGFYMLSRKHILEIKSSDKKEIDKVSNIFLNYLENDYSEFKKNWRKNNDEFEKYKKNLNKKGIYFTPEKVLIKSPITILDSP